MRYAIDGEGLLDLSACGTERQKRELCWAYFTDELAQSRVLACDGKLVRGFTIQSFDHIVSGSSNKYDPSRGHDIPFVERRAARLPLIKEVLSGRLESRAYRVSDHPARSDRRVRFVLCVTEPPQRYYVVVIDDIGPRYLIRTAYPTTHEYYQRRIRARGSFVGTWRRHCLKHLTQGQVA